MATDKFYLYAVDTSASTVTLWLGTWHPNLVTKSELHLISADGKTRKLKDFEPPVLDRSFTSIGRIDSDGVGPCFYTTRRVTRLKSRSAYRVEWRDPAGTVLAAARVVTLPRGLTESNLALDDPMVLAPPDRVPDAPITSPFRPPDEVAQVTQAATVADGGFARRAPRQRPPSRSVPFRVLTGSCFWYRGATDQLELLERFLTANGLLPDLNLLTGDQVYIDQTPWDDWKVTKSNSELQSFVTRRYWSTWRRLKSILKLAPSIMLTDDHEFWNDYPFEPVELWPALQVNSYRGRVKQVTQQFAEAIQQPPLIKKFSLGRDLDFLMMDTRKRRTETRLMPQSEFDKALSWIKNLKAPGVLVTNQPIVAYPLSTSFGRVTDANLPHFGQQYTQLLTAIKTAPRDIFVVSGDIHQGRLLTTSWTQEDGQVRKLFELTASPIRLVEGGDLGGDVGPWDTPPHLPVHSALGPDLGPIGILGNVPPGGGKRMDHINLLTFERVRPGVVAVESRAIALRPTSPLPNIPGGPEVLWTRRFLLGDNEPTALYVNPSSVDFGGVKVGTTSTRYVLVQNVGTERGRVTIGRTTNPLFTVRTGNFRLPGLTSPDSSSRRIRIDFKPGATGPSQGSAEIILNGVSFWLSMYANGVR